MGRYERVDDEGQVLERVYAADGSYEDTRLGVAALEEKGGWRVMVQAPPDEPAEPPESPRPRAR
ncbi:hypothetical protein [Streptosporangium sp. KLBMP 9127]|nr:hypothetical protein [Streptosporangium sp. KLBMP 9127]